MHCSVDLIKLFLKGIVFQVEILDEYGHVTEDVSINDGSNSVRKDDKEYLTVTDWYHIIAG